MKKILLVLSLACLSILPADTYAQWVEVTNGDGTTQNYGGTDVTVTALNPSFNGGCEGTYWVQNTGASYTFTFSPAVSAVQFYCDAINTSEETAFLLNGAAFPLTTCNVDTYINSCSPENCQIVNGVFVNVSASLCGGLITIYGNITSVTLLQQFGNSGTTFDVYIPPGVTIPAPGGDVTGGSNSPVQCGDTLFLTATATGATSYSWTGPNSFTSNQQNPVVPNITTVGAGDYIVTANTACGAVIDTVTVTVDPNNIVPVATSNSPVCEGGTLTLTTGSVNNGVFNWTGPNSFTSGSQNPVITTVPLAAAGVYNVTVSVNGCISQPGSVLVDIDPLPAAPGVTDVEYCLGDTTAVPLTATGNGLVWYTVATGGTPLPGAPTPNTSVDGTTTYYVAATGPGPTFCEGPRAAIDVTVHPLTQLPDIDYIPYYCPGDVFVPFAVVIGQNILYYDVPTGGVGSSVAPTVDVNTPGTYKYYASQTVNGCESGRIPITVIVWPLVDAVYSYEIKYGCTQDTVVFTNTSIGANNKYTWYFGDGTTDTSASPVHIFDSQAVYTVKLVARSPNCKDSLEQVIDIQHPLVASFTTDADTICQHQAITFTNTSTTTTINGITPTYEWTFGDGSTDVAESPVHTFDVTGVYTVYMIVKDFVPCTDTAFRIVYVDTTSALSLMVSDSMACSGQAITFTGNYSEIGLNDVKWEYGDGIVEHNVNPARHTYEQPGTYMVKVSTDYRICRDTAAEIPVVLRPRPIINLGPDTSMCPNAEPLVLADYLNGGNAAASWEWNTGEKSFSIVARQPAMYSATVTIDGCSGTDSVWVKKDCYLDVPNSFTPNGDGLNDYFLPRQLLSESVKTFKMTIYNRWGQEIYQTTRLDGRGWDGNFNGQPQPQGVFVYTIDVSFSNGHKEQYKGNVTLLK